MSAHDRDDPRSGIAAELAAITAEGRLRQRPVIDSPCARTIVLVDGKRKRLINWAANDYLGASQELIVRNGAFRALRSYGAGSGSARLLAGGLRLHRQFEQRIAKFLGSQDALLTSTGFQANLAAVVAIAGDPQDAIVLDRLCHASTYDGARQAAGQLLRFRHNDPTDLELQLTRCASARRILVCIESVYSMDGDEAPITALAAVCRKHRALLLVDEAHALGVLGPGGRGLCAESGVRPDLIVGTCSKSFGSQGGFIAADQDIIELLVNRGRSFIFSTAPCPAAIGAAHAAVGWLRDHPDLPDALQTSIQELRRALRAQGWDVPEGRSAIIPIVVGDEHAALALAQRLRDLGHHCPAIRPPTVPAGSCRLRLSVSRAHTAADKRKLLKAMAVVRGEPSGQARMAEETA